MNDLDAYEDSTRTTGPCACTECTTLGATPNQPGEDCAAPRYDTA